MSRDEPFLSRWSRLKSEAREAPKEEQTDKAPPATRETAPAPEPAPPLPPVEALTPESDFAPFMSPGVDADTRRAALKKLFADSRFNVPDRFEAYSEDYTGGDPIPQEMLKMLNQARRLLFDEAEKTAQAPAKDPEPPQPQPTDAAGKQDA